MDRRSFLRICSASALLELGPSAKLAAASDGRFVSESLGFSFEFPGSWKITTITDEFDRHFAEWGEPDPDCETPVVVLSRFPEPTPRPNYELQVYACDETKVGTLTPADSDRVCDGLEDILEKKRNFISFVERPLDTGRLRC